VKKTAAATLLISEYIPVQYKRLSRLSDVTGQKTILFGQDFENCGTFNIVQCLKAVQTALFWRSWTSGNFNCIDCSWSLSRSRILNLEQLSRSGPGFKNFGTTRAELESQKVTPATSGTKKAKNPPDSNPNPFIIAALYQRWYRIRKTGVDSGRILRFCFGSRSGPGSKI